MLLQAHNPRTKHLAKAAELEPIDLSHLVKDVREALGALGTICRR